MKKQTARLESVTTGDGLTLSATYSVAGPDRDGHNIDWAAKYTGTVRWLRSFWTRIWGNFALPKQGKMGGDKGQIA